MKVGLSLILVLTNIMCSKNNQVADTMPVKVVKAGQLDYWLTKGDQSILFEKQKPLDFLPDRSIIIQLLKLIPFLLFSLSMVLGTL
ncbi:MAG: hypothetical protein IPJ13_17570 [Saprospiraceae bacterium]|nr:hypothetical protein [Saprospiraceae bacterium]